MARRRKLTEGKRNVIAGLISEYNIQTAEDIQEALKDMFGDTIQGMLEAELDNHLGYGAYERSDNSDYRNGTKPITLCKRSVYASNIRSNIRYIRI
ncbi:MAG: transposase [Oscillospiraceae bacterium]|nr:transposase [Oscillospiraceae bacterium]